MKSQYEYDKRIFEFQVYRKHLLSDVKYFGTLLPRFLVLSTKQYDDNPKYVVPLQLNTSIGWTVEKKSEVNQVVFKAFTIPYFENYKDFHASDEILRKLKYLLRNQVTFYKIADFYEAEQNLGKGSSAKVIQVKHLYEKNQYAAKAIDKQYLQKGESGMAAFLAEVQILHQLSIIQDSPFIKLFETFEGEKTYYLIMEIMKGNTLSQEIEQYNQKKQTLPSKIIKIIMKQILTGVKILHEQNIIHRDLKPDNIMFKKKGDYETLTIVDFGLATSTNVLKFTFPKCGTPGYVAPEILNLIDRDQKYDQVCDIFSCGCIFYKLLTGCNLFFGDTFNEILKTNKQCHINYDAFNLLNISDEALELLKAMLTKNPTQRISAQQALDSSYFEQVTSPLRPSFHEQSMVPQITQFNNIFIPSSDSNEDLSPFQKISKRKKSDFEDDISETHGEGIFIRQMPSVKKPTYCKHVDSSIGTFYAKDPLSSFKRLKKESQTQFLEDTPKKQLMEHKNKEEMQQICLFRKQS